MESVTCSPVPYAIPREDGNINSTTGDASKTFQIVVLSLCTSSTSQELSHGQQMPLSSLSPAGRAAVLAELPNDYSSKQETPRQPSNSLAVVWLNTGSLFATEACSMTEAQVLGRRKHCQDFTKSILMLQSVRPRLCCSQVCFLPWPIGSADLSHTCDGRACLSRNCGRNLPCVLRQTHAQPPSTAIPATDASSIHDRQLPIQKNKTSLPQDDAYDTVLLGGKEGPVQVQIPPCPPRASQLLSSHLITSRHILCSIYY
ncbi:hypothetical protein NXS19_004292 [Fusarium pseudograminearum]|nr:hypothetical protein NXS19_004292 [Fusarium pseudograminearum]